MFNTIKGRIAYYRDRAEYKKNYKNNASKLFPLTREAEVPCLLDRYSEAGTADIHYFLQDIEVAKLVIKDRPSMHYDVGSRIDGFITHLLAAGINVTIMDVRPFPVQYPGLYCMQTDAMTMEQVENESINSISSLHAIEHFGLGRYGDPIDVNGWKKALMQFKRVLRPCGILYLSVPIGNENRLVFNAHRIFNPNTIMNEMKGFNLEEFFYIKNYAVFKTKPEMYSETADYLCGIFVFRKK